MTVPQVNETCSQLNAIADKINNEIVWSKEITTQQLEHYTSAVNAIEIAIAHLRLQPVKVTGETARCLSFGS